MGLPETWGPALSLRYRDRATNHFRSPLAPRAGLCKWHGAGAARLAATRRFAIARGIAPGKPVHLTSLSFEPQRGVLKSAPLGLESNIVESRNRCPGAMPLAVAGWAFGPRQNAATCIIFTVAGDVPGRGGETSFPVLYRLITLGMRSSYLRGNT